jgi:hypothetical protein
MNRVLAVGLLAHTVWIPTILPNQRDTSNQGCLDESSSPEEVTAIQKETMSGFWKDAREEHPDPCLNRKVPTRMRSVTPPWSTWVLAFELAGLEYLFKEDNDHMALSIPSSPEHSLLLLTEPYQSLGLFTMSGPDFCLCRTFNDSEGQSASCWLKKFEYEM